MNTLANIETGSVIVALAIIALVGILMALAIVRETVDGALKLWGGLGTLIGLVVGTMGTYFFTKDATQDKIASANAQKEAVAQRAQLLQEALATAEERSSELAQTLASREPGYHNYLSLWRPSMLRRFDVPEEGEAMPPDDESVPAPADPPANPND